jgi:hypothetical protein
MRRRVVAPRQRVELLPIFKRQRLALSTSREIRTDLGGDAFATSSFARLRLATVAQIFPRLGPRCPKRPASSSFARLRLATVAQIFPRLGPRCPKRPASSSFARLRLATVAQIFPAFGAPLPQTTRVVELCSTASRDGRSDFSCVWGPAAPNADGCCGASRVLRSDLSGVASVP